MAKQVPDTTDKGRDTVLNRSFQGFRFGTHYKPF